MDLQSQIYTPEGTEAPPMCQISRKTLKRVAPGDKKPKNRHLSKFNIGSATGAQVVLEA